MPFVNNPIRSKIPWPNIGQFIRLPGRGLTNRMFMVRGSRVTISCGFKVEFCIEKSLHGVFAWADYLVDNVLYESRMKWTWHHSKLAVEEVSFFRGLRVVLLQLLSIHNRAVGVTNLGVVLLWSCRFWLTAPYPVPVVFQWQSSGNPVCLALRPQCTLECHWRKKFGSQCTSSGLPVAFQWSSSVFQLCKLTLDRHWDTTGC